MTNRRNKWRLIRSLQLEMDTIRKRLRVKYHGKEDRVYFDICDLSGRIIRTGEMVTPEHSIDLKDLKGEDYIFLLLDGQDIRRKRFSWVD